MLLKSLYLKPYNYYRKLLFIFSHSVFDPRFYFIYLKTINNRYKTTEELKQNQNSKLKKLIHYAYEHVPYYKTLFDDCSLNPKNIKTTKDLEKIPILTKEIIKQNYDKFFPNKSQIKKIHYFNNATGGTTGTPLKYRISRSRRLRSICNLYKGLGNAGYKLGDRMILLGGQSIGVNVKPNLINNLEQYIRNIKKLSAFDMDDRTMRKYVDTINSYKPKYIRGYPSALYFFSKFIEEKSLTIYSPAAVFTTSENLYKEMRDKIEKIFRCKIYNCYGLRDSGLSAYECKNHKGLHINMSDSILEIVDDNNKQINEGIGKIIGTDLYNYAFPFIRYESGDIAEISPKKCSCGENTPLLKEIMGRTVDILVTPEGKKIHGWFFLYLFWQIQKGIEKYRVEQNKIAEIDIFIIKNSNYNKEQEKQIKDIVKERSPNWQLNFHYVNNIPLSKSGKYKFIVNNLK